jgi:hypothetical protein
MRSSSLGSQMTKHHLRAQLERCWDMAVAAYHHGDIAAYQHYRSEAERIKRQIHPTRSMFSLKPCDMRAITSSRGKISDLS